MPTPIGPVTMETWDGRQLVMDNYSSRAGTLIIFMSSRCSVTQSAVIDILRIHAKYRREEVLFIGLFVNGEETAEEVKAFCQNNWINFPVYRDRDGVIAKQLGARFTPEAFLLDEQGALIHRGGFHGPGPASDMRDAIARFLAKQPVSLEANELVGTPLDTVGVPSTSEGIIEPLAFSSEVIFENIPWAPDHHCSTVAETPNGDLLCVWFGGSFECADDERLFIARQKKGERTWSMPEVLTRGAFLRPAGNAILFRVNPTRMMVFYDRLEERRPIRSGRWEKGQLISKYSDDNGYTWSDDEESPFNLGGIRNPPITLRTGELMVPMSNPKPCFLVTRDGGATWEVSGAMNEGGQPTCIERSDGSLLCFLRSEPFILQSESYDKGKTWTPTHPSILRCPDAGITMTRLHNGHLVLVFDDSTTKRTPLSVALSKDDGATWGRPVSLEANPGEYAYPCVIETSDQRIHVSYTFLRKVIKHATFNERWLTLLSPED